MIQVVFHCCRFGRKLKPSLHICVSYQSLSSSTSCWKSSYFATTGCYTLMSPVIVVDLKKIFFMPNNKDVGNDGGNLITLASRHLVYWVRELVDKQMGCSRNVQWNTAQNTYFDTSCNVENVS